MDFLKTYQIPGLPRASSYFLAKEIFIACVGVILKP